MPAAPTSRALLRQSRLVLRRQHNVRQASTTAETAAKVKEAASTSVSKASEGLSRVTSSAGSALFKAGAGARTALGRVGGRTGRLISFVETLIPPTVYYARVGLELSKIVFKGQQMTPPSIAQFQAYFQPVANALSNPRTLVSSISSIANPESILSTIRNVNRKQFATIGIVGAELLGFFTVGEMIGRLKIVGYHGEPHHEH